MRKHYSATFKAELVKELLKEEKTVSQLASEAGVHPTQLKEWKRIAVTGLPELFSRDGKARPKGTRRLAKEQEKQLTDLYAEIGRLTTQLNCAQRGPEKKSGLNPE